jgi:hypothetical protein
MDINTVPRFEELSDKKTGRIWIDVKVNGELHSFVHVSGPKGDAQDYYEGRITLTELRRRWT